MLAPDPNMASMGVLELAGTLAVERYGKRLRDLDEQYQRDLIVDAKDMIGLGDRRERG